MKRSAYILCILVALSGCALFEPGPLDPATGQPTPSVFELSLKEAAETYSESPWQTLGPWGAGIAGVLAALAGVKKGTEVYKRRKAAKTSE